MVRGVKIDAEHAHMIDVHMIDVHMHIVRYAHVGLSLDLQCPHLSLMRGTMEGIWSTMLKAHCFCLHLRSVLNLRPVLR